MEESQIIRTEYSELMKKSWIEAGTEKNFI